MRVHGKRTGRAHPGMSKPGIPTSKSLIAPVSRCPFAFADTSSVPPTLALRPTATGTPISRVRRTHLHTHAFGGGAKKKDRRRTCDERKVRDLRRDDRPRGGDAEVHHRVHVARDVDAHGRVERRGVRRACGAADARVEQVRRLVEVDRRQLLVQRLVELVQLCSPEYMQGRKKKSQSGRMSRFIMAGE